ncbi:hypothetical protein HRbin33_00045 [bacterium HR33]|nr:hypothetical protein HRbin33_00045 [bacterium HR33]
MVAVPLAALLSLSRPASRGQLAALVAAAGFGLWWLSAQGTVADQVVRAGTLIAAVTFALATRYTRGTATHRVLLSVLVAACSLAVWFMIGGWSWGAVSWWVERRASFGARLVLGRVLNPEAPGGAAPPFGEPRELALWLEEGIRVLADNYAAIATLQLMAALVLALLLYRRIARSPWGLPPGRFRDFRFTEHLGWLGVVSLAVVLVPKLAAAKAAAVNLLIVTGVLYALRGAAVTVFGLGLLGGIGPWAMAVLGLAVVFLLPLVAAGAIVLGVIDASFDLRSRLAGRGLQP